MTLHSIAAIESQNKRTVRKNASRALTVSLLSSAGIFVCQLICVFMLGFFNPGEVISYKDSLLINMSMYLFYLGVPTFAAYVLFRFVSNGKKITLVKRPAPKRPLVYIFGAVGIGYIFNLLVFLLFPRIIEGSSDIGIQASSGTEVLLCFLMYAIFPAILEEMLFRGLILKHLLPYGKWGAILISAILFGVTHMNPRQILFAFVIGVLLGICYEYTGSLVLPMLIHLINNSISVATTLVPQESNLFILLGIMMYVFMGFGIYAIIYYSRNSIKRHLISKAGPNCIGYTLSIPRYLLRCVLNVGFILYAAISIFIISFSA